MSLADRIIDAAAALSDEPAERALIGAMVASEAGVSAALAAELTADDFYRPTHAALFGAILAARQDGTPAEPAALAGWLADHGQLAGIGGGSTLSDLLTGATLPANVGHYAARIRDLHDRRDLLTSVARVAQAADQGADTSRLHAMLDTAARDHAPRVDGGLRSLGEIAEIGLADIEMRATRPRGIPSGFADLDRLLGGFRPGELIVVAGRPGMGKSVLGIDVARHASIRHHLVTAYFSLEMTRMEIFDRILSAESRVPLHSIRNGELTDDDWLRAAKALGPISEAPMYIDDATSHTMASLREALRAHQAKHGLDLVVVDYLALVRDPATARQGRTQELSTVVRATKQLAGMLQVPVIALHQLNRGPEHRDDKRPTMADLRDTGEFEQAANTVILLHRDDYYDQTCARAGEADFIVAKNRNGAKDTVTVASQLHLGRFVDMAI